MLVAVGSTNPVKIEATKRAFIRFYEDVKVIGVDVNSGVPAQPINEDVVMGAMNRAKHALRLRGSDFGVGIEGGILGLVGDYYCAAFVYLVDKEGSSGSGMSGWFKCPRDILPRLLSGHELGELMEERTGIKDIKRGIGAIGYLTNGVITRADFYEHAVIMALTEFLKGGK